MNQVTRHPNDFAAVFAANFNARNIDALVQNYTADAVLDLGGGTFLRGPDQIRGALENFLAPRLPITVTPGRVIVNGDIAYSTMTFSIEGNAPDGQAVKICGTAVDILRREADGILRQFIDLPFGVATP